MHAAAFLFDLIIEPCTIDLNCGMQSAYCTASTYMPPCFWGLLLHTPRLRAQAHTDSQKEQLQRAGHEPVCLVPGFVDNYLCMCLIALFNSASTHVLRAFHSADIEIQLSFGFYCLLLNARGRQTYQPAKFSSSQLQLSQTQPVTILYRNRLKMHRILRRGHRAPAHTRSRFRVYFRPSD